MKATETNLLRFLQGTNQFVIPIYQRTYSWSRKQCQQLWNDIVRAAQEDSPHFIGSVVYIHEGPYQKSSVPQLMVIDGQQRLTTLTLLLLALADAIKDNADGLGISNEEIRDYFLLNRYGKHEQRYKLLLTRSDKDTLIRIVDEGELSTPHSARIVDNYEFFREQIRDAGFSPEVVYKGMGVLMIVDISLDRDHDNPQLIFESLNSTGLDLSQADLIRNYVLMGLVTEQQERVYTNYWYPMEQNFGHAEYSALFDRFMRDYLTVKSDAGVIPNIGAVYESFKAFVRAQQGVAIENIVANVSRYSKSFVRLAFLREDDQEINRLFADINVLRVDVAYPFLLEVYDDYQQQLLSRESFMQILKLVESYVFRRAMCGIPTNTLNKTFATLNKEVDKSDYLESVKRAFLRKDSYRRFPRDEEFRREFVVKDVYNFRTRNYLLGKLENYDHNEPIDISGCTIEHIMPQNPELSVAWQQDLGPDWQTVQARYLHTVGNLTLTGYNSSLSDRPFTEKRDMIGGFRDSHLRLNHALADLKHWNAGEIEKRAQSLATIATKIWAVPEATSSVVPSTLVPPVGPEGDNAVNLDEFYENSPLNHVELFRALRTRILNLDSSIQEVIYPEHVSYQSPDTFVDVRLQKSRVRLCVNIDPDELYDSQGVVEDVTGKGYWGGGNSLVGLTSLEQLDYVMGLIEKAHLLSSEAGVG